MQMILARLLLIYQRVHLENIIFLKIFIYLDSQVSNKLSNNLNETSNRDIIFEEEIDRQLGSKIGTFINAIFILF